MCDTKDKNILQTMVARFEGFHQHYYEETGVLKKLAEEGQSPRVLLVACSDSRVDPAIMLGLEPGEVFMIRNVANMIPPCEQDSAQHGASAALEYAVKHLEVKHIVIMGHAQCGGIRALVDYPERMLPESTSFIERWMSLGQGMLARAKERHPDASPDELAFECEKDSILNSIKNLESFDFVKTRLMMDMLKIHGWYFDMNQGRLLGYDPEREVFEALTESAAQLLSE